MLSKGIGARLLSLGVGLLALLTLAMLFERWFWAADLLVSFRPIVTAYAMLLLLAALLSRRQTLALIVGAICLFNGWDQLPYYWPQANVEQRNLHLLLYNADRNYLPYAGIDSIVALLHEEAPQVAILLEVGESSAEALIAAMAGEYEHHFAHQDISTDGFLIFSQVPLISAEATSIGGGRLAATFAIEINGQHINIVAPHPTNPLWSLQERNHQLHELSQWVAETPSPLIVAGDLNITMWSRYYKAIERAGVSNSRLGRGLLPTWESPIPFMSLPIDHILISDEIMVHDLRLAQSLGSDHLPQIATLFIPAP